MGSQRKWKQPQEGGLSGMLRDSALVLGGLTALAYAVAFSFEAGYCRYFDIPLYVISPTPSIVLGAVLGIAFALLAVGQFVAIERFLLQKAPIGFRIRVELTLLLCLAVLGTFGLSRSAAAAVAFLVFTMWSLYLLQFLFAKGSLSE